MRAYIFGFLTAANSRLTGRWLGAQLGSVSFAAAAACSLGVKFGCDAVAHKIWGLYKADGPGRETEAVRDMGSFESGFHLFSWCLGAWPVRLIGAQTQMPCDWAINFLLSFSAQLHLEPSCTFPTPSSFGGEAATAGGLSVRVFWRRLRKGRLSVRALKPPRQNGLIRYVQSFFLKLHDEMRARSSHLQRRRAALVFAS